VIRQFGSTSQQIESLHCGLIIGPFLLEWNSTHSICIPRKITSNALPFANRSYRIAEIFNMSMEAIIDAIAPEISNWNQNITFSTKQKNGVQFIDNILERLQLPHHNGLILSERRLGASLFDFVNTLRSDGKLQFRILLPTSTGNFFRQFTTHAELDHHVRDLIRRDSNYTINKYSEYALLTMFDQVFWAKKHLVEHADYAPLMIERSVTCPCGNPEQ
jgi:hypothetical protein